MNHENEGLPEIDGRSPMFEILRHAMALTEELIAESHKAGPDGQTPDEDERREWLETATELTSAMLIAKSTLRHWNRHTLSPERSK